MNRPGHSTLQIAKGVGGIFPYSVGSNQSFAVFPDPFSGRLLIGDLNAAFRVLLADTLVAGQHKQRRAGGVGRGNIHDHVGEARALGAGRRRDLAGDPNKTICRRAHHPLGAPTETGNPFLGQ